ncbi:MAG: hypothetical protein H8E20_11650 [Verrucomicrobia bacterium]|nr:hypothetical protein [Verrucomicrobiota bacterium]
MARSKTFASRCGDFTLTAVVLSKAPWVIPVVAACLLTAKPGRALGQEGASTGRFRITEKSADSRRISILTGSEAVFQGDGMLLTHPRLVTVTDEGKTNLVFTASECLYDQDKKTIRSPGALSLATGDGQMQLKGIGFTGNLVGPTLSVSSDVEARLDKKASRRPLGQARKKKETPASEPLRITSDQFNLEPGQALFRGSVLVKDADGNLSSDSIAVGMGEDDWEVQTIRATGSVVLRAEQIQTTSEQADYDLSAGLIVLKGNPSWTMGERSGRADLLMIHRESQSVNAEGEVTMKLPADSVAEGGLLDFAAPGDGAAGGLPLEIRSNVFLYQSATPDKTGFARYIGAVRLARGEGRLRCSFLNVRLAKGVGGVVESVNAAVGVRLMQGENQLTAQTATYDLAQNTIRFLGEPKWNWGTQSGRARLVELSPADGVFRASGRVRMQLPRPGGDGQFLVSSGAKTEPGGEPLLVVCDSFEYRQAAKAKGLDSATFNGKVVLSGDGGSRVQAQRVAMGIDPGAAGLVSLDATGGLVATTTGANAMRYAGDRLVYTPSDETVHLTGRPSVEIRTRRDGAEVIALGQAAIYNLGTGWLRLSGDPVLKTAEGELRGREIVFNPQTKRLKATGRWKMTLNPNTVAKMRGRTEPLDETKP